MRRDFSLPEQDVEYLDASGYTWEAIRENNLSWVLIHDFNLPSGYNVTNATAALRIDNGYPTSQIDMVYFFPHLHRADGKSINALVMQSIDGKQYQRWSRHRTSNNPWRRELDDISTHLSLVTNWLEREFKLR